MHVGWDKKPGYFVRIARHGADTFGWEICSRVNSVEVDRSARQYSSRIEALLASARAAATLNFNAIEPSSGNCEEINRSN
jgi:hypothetical protein